MQCLQGNIHTHKHTLWCYYLVWFESASSTLTDFALMEVALWRSLRSSCICHQQRQEGEGEGGGREKRQRPMSVIIPFG